MYHIPVNLATVLFCRGILSHAFALNIKVGNAFFDTLALFSFSVSAFKHKSHTLEICQSQGPDVLVTKSQGGRLRQMIILS